MQSRSSPFQADHFHSCPSRRFPHSGAACRRALRQRHWHPRARGQLCNPEYTRPQRRSRHRRIPPRGPPARSHPHTSARCTRRSRKGSALPRPASNQRCLGTARTGPERCSGRCSGHRCKGRCLGRRCTGSRCWARRCSRRRHRARYTNRAMPGRPRQRMRQSCSWPPERPLGTFAGPGGRGRCRRGRGGHRRRVWCRPRRRRSHRACCRGGRRSRCRPTTCSRAAPC